MYKILNDLGLRSDQFRNKVILVTGGARGIGEVSVRFLAFLGAKVVLADISSRGQGIVNEVNAIGGDTIFVPTDMSALDSIDALVDTAIRYYGRIDVLLSSAARVKVETISDFSAAAWDDSYFTNLRGPTYLISKLLPGMRERGYGVILALISLEGAPYVANYCAQKMALRSMLISLGRELGHDSSVSCIAVVPGSVDTPLLHETVTAIAAASGAPVAAVMDALKDNPGYDGLVPVEHSAASCLYFIANAEKFHGQFVDGYLPVHEHGVIYIDERSDQCSSQSQIDLIAMPSPKRELIDFVRTNLAIEQRIKDRTTKLEQEKSQLHERALTDILTGLPNRLLLDDRLKLAMAEARRNMGRIALMFIDLDEFKPVNDTYGHHVGDLLLKEAARRMQCRLRETDTIARIGGDEFVVLLSACEGGRDVRAVAEKIRDALEQPFQLSDKCVRISSSIGVAVYPEHGDNENTLMKNADAAMYAAKNTGRNNIKFAQPGNLRESRTGR